MNMRAYPFRCAAGHRHSSTGGAKRCYYCRRLAHGMYKGAGHYRATRSHLPDDMHPLVRKLFLESYKQRMDLKALENRSGVSRGAIRKWKNRSNPSLTNFEACMNALGFKVVVRPQDWRPTKPGIQDD